MSGFKGVSRSGGRWRAKITKNDKQFILGHFDDAEDAARAYDAAALRMHREFARVNFPQSPLKLLVGGAL